MAIAHPEHWPPEGGPVVLYGLDWESYEALVKLFEDRYPALRMTYLEGTLEIMKTSRDHEEIKKIIARLLEIWAVHHHVTLNGLGHTTFRKQAKERGLEPDECYALGALGDAPDIAIEVVKTRGVIDKLDVYAGLGVKEVWTWKNGALQVHRLVGDRYELADSSALLPDLDIPHLVSFVSLGADQTDTVRAYWDSLKRA